MAKRIKKRYEPMPATESGSTLVVTDSEKVEFFHNVHRVEPDQTGERKRATIVAKGTREEPHVKINPKTFSKLITTFEELTDVTERLK
ncbi:hypothetical protein JTB14_027441 [Gonioctena quinquepunctata]|nr:hypothetical protein JTB14_027441 [Gonioctena quinquepunctata]